MMQTQQQQPPQADSMLEVYMAILDGKTNDPLLDEINLGSGYYSNSEYWLQVETFRHSLFATAAMARAVIERAKHETKWALVNMIFDQEDAKELQPVEYEEPEEGQSRRDYFDAYAEEIWDSLGTDQYTRRQHQAILINEFTGLSHDWTPPHWRMLKMRHKASQSKDAQALDNAFGRVREFNGSNTMDMEDAT